eukprot:9159030-Pyramimonas_sp.AAC.1
MERGGEGLISGQVAIQGRAVGAFRSHSALAGLKGCDANLSQPGRGRVCRVRSRDAETDAGRLVFGFALSRGLKPRLEREREGE